MGGGGERKGGPKEYFIAGGIAGVVSRTCIAPIERVKILFQIHRASACECVRVCRLTPLFCSRRATYRRRSAARSAWRRLHAHRAANPS